MYIIDNRGSRSHSVQDDIEEFAIRHIRDQIIAVECAPSDKIDVHHPEYEHVNHPAHYNGHPSGIECIDLAELMPFNVGNAYKYVFRRGDKGKVKQDLEKALWYLEKERSRLLKSLHSMPLGILSGLRSNSEFSEIDFVKAQRVIAMEPNPLVADFYALLFEERCIRDYYENLDECIGLVTRLKESV